jgi:hypothetical protein
MHVNIFGWNPDAGPVKIGTTADLARREHVPRLSLERRDVEGRDRGWRRHLRRRAEARARARMEGRMRG